MDRWISFFFFVWLYFVGVWMVRRFCSCRESGIGLCEGDTIDDTLFGINVMIDHGYESLTNLSFFASILLFLVSAML